MSEHHRQSSASQRFLIRIFFSLLIGVVVSLLGFLLLAKLVVNQNLTLPQAALPAVLMVGLGCFAAAFCLGYSQKRNGILWGLTASGFFGFVFGVSSLVNGISSFTTGWLLKLCCILLSGCLGGYLGSVQTQSRHRKKRRAG